MREVTFIPLTSTDTAPFRLLDLARVVFWVLLWVALLLLLDEMNRSVFWNKVKVTLTMPSPPDCVWLSPANGKLRSIRNLTSQSYDHVQLIEMNFSMSIFDREEHDFGH